MKLRLLFFLLTLSLMGCDQTGLAIGQSVKNAVTLPYRAVTGLFSDREYEKVEKRSLDIQSDDCDESDCKSMEDTPLEEVLDLKDVTTAILNNACECRSWGTCEKNVCSCEKLCPNSFEIFKRENVEKLSDLSSPENSLAFRNGGGGSKYEMTQGYCWGHASMTSRFNRLAFFDDNEKAPFDLKSSDYEEQMKAVDFYKERIDLISQNKATSIPGFKNLREFSDHPALQSYIADVVAETWAKNAMSFQGLINISSSKPSKREDNEKMFYELKEKIDSHQQPQLLFNEEGNALKSHVALISHYEIDSKGEMILCVRDNNYDPLLNQACMHRMYLDDDGHVRYSEWGKMGKVKLAHNDNADALKQFNSLYERCQSEYDCSQ